MKLHTQLYNLPVIDRLSGETRGYLRNVVCRPGGRKAEGIVYEEKGLLKRCVFVPWQAVAVMGDFSVIIDGSKGRKPPRAVGCETGENRVYSSDGRYVGRISNYLLDEKTGVILGMELSASIVDDLKNGRKIIENTGNIMQGEGFLVLAAGGQEVQSERRSENERLF